MNQPQFTFPRASRRTDPITSHMAEASITGSGRRQGQCDMVMAIVREHGGLTSKELTQYAPEGTDRYTFSRRLPDLEAMGKVVRGESRRCTVGGQLSVTWFAA